MRPMSAIHKLPAVGRIEGVVLQPDKDPKKSVVFLQYKDPSGGLHQLDIPLLDALYLLNMLELASKENGYDHLRRDPTKN